jgi:BMFP domain-containing protein YqiC
MGCAIGGEGMHRHGADSVNRCVMEVRCRVSWVLIQRVIAETDMSFLNSSGLDDLARRLADSVPESVRAFGRDLEGNFKAVLQAQLSKLDLVSRQEFDVQAAILERTQAKLADMEARLKEIEAKYSPQ